jgi:voltage-gated potassium channel
MKPVAQSRLGWPRALTFSALALVTWLVFLFGAPRDIDPWPVLGFLLFGVGAPAAEAIFRASDRSATRGLVAFMALYTWAVLIATYSTVYYNTADEGNWSRGLSHVDALLLTMGTLTTAGTGDIQPRSELARGLLTIQMTLDVVVVTIMATVVLSRLSKYR